MFVLARDSALGPVSIKSIAREQHISETYLEQLFSALRKKGLVKSVRGAQGGYSLTAPPEEVTVGSILSALEGPLTPADCVVEGCANAGDCITHSIWCRIYEGINRVVDSITLQDMLDDFNGQRSAAPEMPERCK